MTEVHSCSYYCARPGCIKAQRDELRDRLAQPEQPPQRKPLTDDEIDKIYETKVWDARRSFARAIEAAHGIKEDA